MEDKNELFPDEDGFLTEPSTSEPPAEDGEVFIDPTIFTPEAPAQEQEEDFVESFFREDVSEQEIPAEMPAMDSYMPEKEEEVPTDEPWDSPILYDPEPPVTPDMDDTQLCYAPQSSVPTSQEDAELDSIIADFSSAPQAEVAPFVPYDPILDAPQETQIDAPFRADEPESKEEFDAMLDTPPVTEDIPHRKHKRTKKIPRKRRPKHRKGDGFFGIPHLLVTAVWLFIVIAIGTTLGKLLWVGAADVLAFGRENKPVTLTIVESDTIDTIAAKLQDAGLVKYPELFKLYAKITGAEDEIITGYFELNTILDYHALTNALSPSSSNRTVTEVMIPEGYNCRQIFQLLADNNVCSVASLEEYAANGAFSDFWFLEGLERGDRYCLEGYLFPDTYQFYVNSTPREALGKLLTGFNNRFSDEMRAKIPALNERFAEMMRKNGVSEEEIAERALTARDIVIIASLIEEETAGSAESATIASVIYNRLAGKQAYERYLNIDASIYYALDGNIDPETGKVMPLTSEDLKIDSPFNTYTNAGLTPTPISNPGLSSLNAALEPQSTDYFYYVLNPETRLHQFSKTYEEHQKWVEKFRTSEDAQ